MMKGNEKELVNLAPGIRRFNQLHELAIRFSKSSPAEVLEWAFAEFRDHLVIATGFGVEGMALLDMAVKINPHPQVFFLDTGFLFPETYALRRTIEKRYGIEIQAYQSQLTPELQGQLYGDKLWEWNPDLCCQLRKLEPLGDVLHRKQAWITAIRREQTATRATAKIIEWDYRWQLVKVNPLVYWSKKEVWQYAHKNNVPYNPLHNLGYPSIGCTHCTRPIVPGEEDRAGRWSGNVKTECGLHVTPQT